MPQKNIEKFCSEFTKYDSIKRDCPSEKAAMVICKLFSKLRDTCDDPLWYEKLQGIRDNLARLPRFFNQRITMKEIRPLCGEQCIIYMFIEGSQHVQMNFSAGVSVSLYTKDTVCVLNTSSCCVPRGISFWNRTTINFHSASNFAHRKLLVYWSREVIRNTVVHMYVLKSRLFLKVYLLHVTS